MTMDAITRGQFADQILNNQVFKDCFTMLESMYKDKMAMTLPEDVAERNRWHACVFVLNDVKTALTATVTNGKVEETNTKLREQVKENDGKRND